MRDPVHPPCSGKRLHRTASSEGDTDEESRVFLYRYLETEGEEPQLENIDDDEEFEIVADAYDEWLDAQEYEALDLDALGLDSLE